MSKYDIVLHPRRREVLIGNQVCKYVNCNSKLPQINFHCQYPSAHTQTQEEKKNLNKLLERNKIIPISSSEKLILPPQQTTVLKCKTKTGFNGKVAITLPESVRVKGLSIESALHQIDRNVVYVHISNDRSGPLTLEKGTQICNLEIYEHNIETVNSTSQSYEGTVGTLNKSAPVSLVDRRSQISSQLNPTDFPEYFDRLVDLLNKYEDTVALKGDKLGKTDIIKHHINIPPGTPPIYIPCYRIPHSQKEIMNEKIQEMLEHKIISPSHSPWSSPLLLIPKRDGTHRIVVDFRQLNKLTIRDPYPVPSLRDLISSIGENQAYTTLDLLSGFWQIELDDQSKPLTGFSSDLGHFSFERMPF